jgi:hypothetical protein
MAEACACYIINEGYLLPALVSALQARAHLSVDKADVVIVLIGEPSPATIAAQGVAEANGVRIVQVPKTAIGDLHIMFARLLVHQLLPAGYRRIIYIDGDTQVRGDLDPLVEAAIPKGRFLACRDPAALFAKLSARWRRRIVQDRTASGFDRPFEDYFNSGVMVIDRDSWPRLAEASIAMLELKGAQFRFADQDILNLAVGEHCLLIPNRWNFPGFLIGSEADAATRPSIYHFMSNPRPWNEAVRPWGAAWMRPYRDLLERHPELGFLAPRPNRLRGLRYWLQQEVKMALEYNPVGRLTEPEAQLVL